MQLNNFTYCNIEMTDDYDGKVAATLISSNSNSNNRQSVLYLHGFIDYFFHPHLAEKILESGYDFYALELRKYGNSLSAHQHPNYCKNIEEYFEEISFALNFIYEKSNKPIILLGHSTGGLIASYYMNYGKHKNLVSALILNSPFLQLNVPKFSRFIIPFLSKVVSSINPYAKITGVISPVYAQSLHKDYFGEWDFNLDWKPIEGFPAYFAWLAAISKAQKRIEKYSDIKVPVLVMYSDKSFLAKEFTEETKTADIVLNVKDIADCGLKLGNKIKMLEISNAMHDIFLSKKDVREYAMSTMIEWLKNK